MSDPAADYVAARAADPELEAMNARLQAAREADQNDSITELIPKGVRNVVSAVGDAKNLGRNALVAVYDALRNTSELMVDMGTAAGTGEQMRQAADSGQPAPKPLPPRDLADLAPDFVQAMDGLRDRANKDATGADIFVQKALQFAVPFAGAMKVLGPSQGLAGTVGKAVAADAAVSASVWDPHEGRFADLLQTIVPDGALIGPVIDYLASDPEDSEAEGRLKNVLDSQLATLVVTPALAGTIGLVKAGASTLRKARAGLLHPEPVPAEQP